jgi:type II secretory pathway pseudopilin PulG
MARYWRAKADNHCPPARRVRRVGGSYTPILLQYSILNRFIKLCARRTLFCDILKIQRATNFSFMQLSSAPARTRLHAFGLTIVEILIAVFIFGLIVAAISLFVTRGTTSSRSIVQQARTVEDARVNLNRIQDLIRNAQYPNPTTDWLATASDNELVFYANADGDIEIEKIRYSLNGTDLERGVIQPDANGNYPSASEEVTVIARSLQNQLAGQPLFTYVVENIQVQRVGIHLVVDHTPDKQPPTLVVDTEATPRLTKTFVPPPIPSPLPSPPVCQGDPLDLMLVLDASGTVDNNEFEILRNFSFSVANAFNVSPSSARIGVLQFAGRFPPWPDTALEIGLSGDRVAVEAALTNMNRIQGQTYIWQGIADAQQEIATRGRAGAEHVMVLITDGQPSDGQTGMTRTLQEADNAKAADTEIFTVYIGGHPPGIEFLEQVASRPEYAFAVTDFNALERVLTGLISSICAQL